MTFIEKAMKGYNTQVVTDRGITGTGQVLAFCGFTINAPEGQFAAYCADRVADAAVKLYEERGHVATRSQPRAVKATYGYCLNIPHFVPRLHVLLSDGRECIGDLVFTFKGELHGLLQDDGTIVPLN